MKSSSSRRSSRALRGRAHRRRREQREREAPLGRGSERAPQADAAGGELRAACALAPGSMHERAHRARRARSHTARGPPCAARCAPRASARRAACRSGRDPPSAAPRAERGAACRSCARSSRRDEAAGERRGAPSPARIAVLERSVHEAVELRFQAFSVRQCAQSGGRLSRSSARLPDRRTRAGDCGRRGANYRPMRGHFARCETPRVRASPASGDER